MHGTQPHDKMTTFKIFWKDMWVLRQSFSSIAVPWTTCQKICIYYLFVSLRPGRCFHRTNQWAVCFLYAAQAALLPPAARIHNRGTSRRAFVKRLMVRKKRVRNKWTTKQKCENPFVDMSWIFIALKTEAASNGANLERTPEVLRLRILSARQHWTDPWNPSIENFECAPWRHIMTSHYIHRKMQFNCAHFVWESTTKPNRTFRHNAPSRARTCDLEVNSLTL